MIQSLSPAVRLLGAVQLGLFLLGCGKSATPPAAAPPAGECPEGQTFDGQFCQVTGTPPPEAAPREAPPAEATPATATETPAPSAEPAPPPEAPATAESPATSPPSLATPVDVSMAAQAGPLITYLAGSHLPSGARPFGAPFAAQFAEGQVFEQQLKLTVGKCYTVVAAGLPPMSEVALELYDRATTTGVVAPAPTPLARDDSTGPQAVLGSRAACVKPTAADLWLVVRASKGQGVIAGQVFEK